jgi:hypothetical protein
MRVLIALALAGCYQPSVKACQYACASSGACPEGLVCSASGNMCVANRNDTCVPGDGAVSDVPPTPCTLFAQPAIYGTQTNPKGVAIGDINNDLVIDVAVATQGNPSFDTLFGTAGGALAPGFTQVVVGPTFTIAVMASAIGPEVAITEAGSGVDSASTYHYNGGNVYQQEGATGTGAGGHPEAMVVGHFDADTLADIAVANTTVNDLWTFNGTSNGQLGSLGHTTGLAATTTALATADLSGDGRDDLVIGNSASGYQVGIDDPSAGAFSLAPAVATSGNPVALALVDLNGDHKPDLVIATPNALQVALGNGDGTFQPLTSSPFAGAEGLAVGDFDRDGVVDVAVTSSSTDSVTVFEGVGDGRFKAPAVVQLDAGAKLWGIAAGDLNGDMVPDLVVTYSGKNEIAVLLDTCMP